MGKTPQLKKFWIGIAISLLFFAGLIVLWMITDSVIWIYLSILPCLCIYVVFVVTFSNKNSYPMNKQCEKSKYPPDGRTMATPGIRVLTILSFIVCALSATCLILTKDLRWIVMIVISFILLVGLAINDRNKR